LLVAIDLKTKEDKKGKRILPDCLNAVEIPPLGQFFTDVHRCDVVPPPTGGIGSPVRIWGTTTIRKNGKGHTLKTVTPTRTGIIQSIRVANCKSRHSAEDEGAPETEEETAKNLPLCIQHHIQIITDDFVDESGQNTVGQTVIKTSKDISLELVPGLRLVNVDVFGNMRCCLVIRVDERYVQLLFHTGPSQIVTAKHGDVGQSYFPVIFCHY